MGKEQLEQQELNFPMWNKKLKSFPQWGKKALNGNLL